MATSVSKGRKVSIEEKLAKEELKQDAEILREVTQSLPSGSRIKFYKADGEDKTYISSVNAEDFIGKDYHEYIKGRFVKKYGGGEYVLEFVDSSGEVAKKVTISVAGDKESGDVRTDMKYLSEAIDLRDEAFERMKEAEEEKRRVERERYDTLITALQSQWDTMQKMYEAQIEALKEQYSSSENKQHQQMIQMQIEKIRNEMEKERQKFEMEIKQKEEARHSTDRIFDLVNTFLPLILQKSEKEGRDPAEEFMKTVSLVEKMVGQRKDIVESMIENPERAAVLRRLLGLGEDDRKKGSFLDDMLENPQKFELFKKMFGVEDKKDFLSEMIENPQRFEVFKKVLGVDKQEELIESVKSLAEKAQQPVAVEEKKDFLDEILDARQKFEALKGLFQPPQPARTLIELVSNIINNMAQHVPQAINSYMNGLVTVEMIKRGMIKSPEDIMGGRQAMPHAGNMHQHGGYAGEYPSEQSAVPVSNIGNEGQVKTASGEQKPDIEKVFGDLVVAVISRMTRDGEVDPDKFVDIIAKNVIKISKEHPDFIFEVLKRKDIKHSVKQILIERLEVDEDTAGYTSEAIISRVLELFQNES